MPDRIAVDFDVLTQHAGRVEGIGRGVEVARSAAAGLDLGGGAFGLMCAFLVPPASLVSRIATDAIAAAGELVDRSAREIREVAADFRSLEADLGGELDAVRAGIE